MEKEKSIEANIKVHSKLANTYNEDEPHYKKESVARVSLILNEFLNKTSKVADFGCGTGFIIDIIKDEVSEIVGVDITEEMLSRVTKGSSELKLIKSDVVEANLPSSYFDLVTAYSFLDHVYDLSAVFKKAYDVLKNGGVFYADLNPNKQFWNTFKTASNFNNEILSKEFNGVSNKTSELEEKYQINSETFIQAEYSKHVDGGFDSSQLKHLLELAGFREIQFIYHWFAGESIIINDTEIDKTVRFQNATTISEHLTKLLPISNNLFKYIGFKAIK